MFTKFIEVEMKEIIFRILSLIIGIGGLFAFFFEGTMFSGSTFIGAIVFIAVILSFILFGLGGPKLLSKIPFTEWLNETAVSFFNTGEKNKNET